MVNPFRLPRLVISHQPSLYLCDVISEMPFRIKTEMAYDVSNS